MSEAIASLRKGRLRPWKWLLTMSALGVLIGGTYRHFGTRIDPRLVGTWVVTAGPDGLPSNRKWKFTNDGTLAKIPVYGSPVLSSWDVEKGVLTVTERIDPLDNVEHSLVSLWKGGGWQTPNKTMFAIVATSDDDVVLDVMLPNGRTQRSRLTRVEDSSPAATP